jgi:integrase
MARTSNRLGVKTIAKVTKSGAHEPGRHADGEGLFLQVEPSGKASWVFIFRSPVHRVARGDKTVGKSRVMGLGAVGEAIDGKVTLAAARDLAASARALVKTGVDPLEAPKVAAPATVPTLGEVADRLIAAKGAEFRNEKHLDQWKMTLKEYAKPLRAMPVNEITTEHVLACLKPHWARAPETASRLQGRIERVLNAAKAEGHRTGENPATWRGHLENLLPKRQKLSRGHHAAMPWKDVPAFLASLRQQSSVGALAVEFTVLTAARSGEVRGAKWDEIDTDAKVWTVPANRMKAGIAHQVPLVPRAVEILETLARLPRGAFIFPSTKRGKQLSDMTLSAVLKRMNINVTVHGFRATFRMWAGDTGAAPREIAEACLAHVISNRVEAAYNRSSQLERRRALMLAWAQFCEGNAVDKVVPIRREANG